MHNATQRIIITGGGTAGHIFPGIAIAHALKEQNADIEILFVGSEQKMEMQLVPAAGYKIIGLSIQGIRQGSLLKNIGLPFKLVRSIGQSFAILRDFKPHAIVGVGGYVSGPLLYAAYRRGIPFLIQEHNAHAGKTNRCLGKKAQKICVAFDGMEQFFPAGKIVKTGNPVRKECTNLIGKLPAARKYFQLHRDKKVLLVLGGSLGAKTLNESILAGLDRILRAGIQIIWQTGQRHYEHIQAQLPPKYQPHVRLMSFIDRIDLCYAAADVVIARAGAGLLAELCLLQKPTILVPSPNVAEDHQSKNALTLVKRNAALLVTDEAALSTLVDRALALLKDEQQQRVLSERMVLFARPNAAEVVAKEVLQMMHPSQ